MARTLTVGLILFSSLAAANAQPPKARSGEAEPRDVREVQVQQADQEQRAVKEFLLRKIHAQMEMEKRLVIQGALLASQPDGDDAGVRRRFDAQLAAQIGIIDRVCRLTDAQKRKLQLAGRGDIKRFFDRFDEVKRKSQVIELDGQNLDVVIQDLGQLRPTLQDNLFTERSLLSKALPNTLTREQLTSYEALVRARYAFGEVRLLEGHQGEDWRAWVTRLAATPDGRKVVTVGGDAVRLWEVETGKTVRVFGQNQSGYWSVAFSRDGRRIATGSNDHTARVWDSVTGREVQRLLGHSAAIWGVAFSPDGRQLITGAWDQSLRVWDIETGKQLRKFEGVPDNIRCLALSPDGKLVAAGHFAGPDQPGILRLWNLAQGKEIRTFRGHQREISSVVFSPDGRKLLTAGYDRTVRLWDVNNGKEILRLDGHTHRVEGAAFSPDGRCIISCGNQFDGTVRIWDAAQGQELLCSERCEGGFLDVAVLPDGRHLVTAGKDSMGRLWPWPFAPMQKSGKAGF